MKEPFSRRARIVKRFRNLILFAQLKKLCSVPSAKAICFPKKKKKLPRTMKRDTHSSHLCCHTLIRFTKLPSSPAAMRQDIPSNFRSKRGECNPKKNFWMILRFRLADMSRKKCFLMILPLGPQMICRLQPRLRAIWLRNTECLTNWGRWRLKAQAGVRFLDGD